MNQRYIKVVQKDGSEFVTLKSNESFHRSRKSEIKEPTQEEIEKYFPEEKEKINADKDVLKIQNLEIELAETKKLLFEANEKLNLLSNSNEPGTEEKAKRGRPSNESLQ